MSWENKTLPNHIIKLHSLLLTYLYDLWGQLYNGIKSYSDSRPGQNALGVIPGQARPAAKTKKKPAPTEIFDFSGALAGDYIVDFNGFQHTFIIFVAL